MLILTLTLALLAPVEAQKPSTPAELVEQLGNAKYRVRCRAHAALRTQLHTAAPAIRTGLKHQDPEIAHRCKMLWERYCMSIRPSGYSRVPWIDMLPQKHPDRQKTIDKHLNRCTTEIGVVPTRDWWGYRQATQYLIQDLLSQGKTKKEVVGLLDRMVVSEREWIKDHQGEYPWLFNQLGRE